ncbi:MAG TPA: hypothetical protein VE081_00200 [Sporichthyaceae bacterium]|nr:hypothetical protein [Sporichthyaceae bacterium]
MSARRISAVEALFWGAVLAAGAAVAIWPPHTVDGPAHLLGAVVLTEHHEPLYAQLYRLNWFPTPNLGGSLLLAGLVKPVGLRAAETMVQIACVVGLPLALRYAIRALRPEQGWLGLAALPFAFNYLYFYGFYSFCLGLVGCLSAVGLALRAAPAWRPARTAALAATLTATWFLHLVPFALGVLFLGAQVVVGPRRVRTLVAGTAAAVPGIALTLAYAAHTAQGSGPTWNAPPGLLVGLVSLHTPLVTYSHWENVVGVGLALALLTVAICTRTSEGRGARPVAVAGGAATLLYLAAPDSLGVDFGLINDRLSLFPILFGLLWLAARPIPPRAAFTLAGASLAALVALVAIRVPTLRHEDRLADEYARAAQFLRPGTTLVALRFAEFGPDAGRNGHWDPLRHLSSRLAAGLHAVDVGHYEAEFDYFPTQFRPGTDPRRMIDPSLLGLPAVPPYVQLGAANPPVEFVLLIGTENVRTGPAAAALAATRAELAKNYTRRGATRPSGLVEVWQHN